MTGVEVELAGVEVELTGVEVELAGVEVELTHLFSLPKLDDKHTCLGADLAFVDNNTHTHTHNT